MERTLVSRARNAAERWRLRFLYERIRPELSTRDVLDRVDPAHAIADGNRIYSDLLAAHLATTPRGFWASAPAADANTIDRARRGEWELLGHRIQISPATDWHADPIFGARWAQHYTGALSYRRERGDVVLLWHLNKMMFLLDVAAAYRATRDPALAMRVYELIDSWCLANPYMVGMNWVSPLDIGTRLAVWSQALAAVADAALPDEDRCKRIVRSVLRQADHVAAHYSEWPIPNNHLVGEAAMMHAFATYWPVWKDSKAWLARAEAILVSEAERQVLKDGVQFEASVNYHAYALDFFLLYLHAKALAAEPPHRVVADKTRAMATAHMKFAMPSGRWPRIGDDSIDRFFVLAHALDGPPLSANGIAFNELVRPAHAVLFASTDWGRELLGANVPLHHAHHFADAGVSVARDANYGLMFIHGPQHRNLFSNGHLHADAGSFELELEGVPFVIDAGTYVYFADPEARAYFKGARAHNAPLVDDLEPMRSLEPFRWENLASGEYLGLGADGDTVGVVNRRKLLGAGGVQMEHTRTLVLSSGTVLVFDTIRARDESRASSLSHSATFCFRTPTPPGTASGDGARVSVSDPHRFVRVFESFADRKVRVDSIDDPTDRRSWHSNRYGTLQCGVSVQVSAEFEAGVTIVTAIRTTDVSVVPLRLEATDSLVAIESHGGRRLIRVQTDPASIVVAGNLLVGRGADAARESRKRGPVSAGASAPPAWLDELASGSQ